MIKKLFIKIQLRVKKFWIKEIVDKRRFTDVRKMWNELNKTKFNNFNIDYFYPHTHIDKSLNQYIRQKFLKFNFLNSLLFFFKSKNLSFIYPLPQNMLKIIDQNGYKPNFFFCKTLWAIVILFHIFLSFFYFFYFFLKLLHPKLKHGNKNIDQFNFVNLNMRDQKEKIKDWIKIQYSSNINENYFSEDEVILSGIKNFQFYNFLIWFIKNLFYSIYQLFHLRWYYILLLPENIKAAVVKYSNYGCNKINIFFWLNNIYKPLWTNKNLNNKSDTCLIYGGIFDEILVKGKTELEPDWIGTEICTWENHLVLTERHREFLIKKYPIKIKTEFIKKPFIINSKKINEELPKNYMAVFAYENRRHNVGIGTFAEYEYSNGRNYIHGKLIFDFYNDLLNICKKNNIKLVTKRKKKGNKNSIKLINNFFNRLSDDSNFIQLDAEDDVIDIIKKSLCCVSLPITSTGVLAQKYNIPSSFYDPYNWINRQDPSLSNLKVYNFTELDTWLKNLNKNE